MELIKEFGEVEYYNPGIVDIKRLREFTKSLPKELKNIWIKYVMTDRESSLLDQESMELSFITDHWDELVEEGWLVEN